MPLYQKSSSARWSAALEEYMSMNVSDLPWLLSCLRSSDKRKRTRMDLDGGRPRDPTRGTIANLCVYMQRRKVPRHPDGHP